MRIGIDIDGVLIDIEKWSLDVGAKYFFKTYGIGVAQHDAYDTTKLFGISREQDDEFWNKYYVDYSKNTPARMFSSEVIEKLKNDGHEIYIITARGSFLPNIEGTILTKKENQDIVKYWLKKEKIYYDKLIFSPEDKLNICLKNNIDIMIEDKPANINKISTKLPVICFHSEYNKQCTGKSIITAYSWYDLYCKLQKYLESNK